MIDLRQVVKTYQSSAGKFTALKGIDLQIDSGEFVAIVGKSGSGKTTLINVLTGIDRPTTGEVFIAGTPVHQLDEGQLAAWRGANLGIVFQFFQLLPTLTVLENVRLPMDFGNLYTRRERRSAPCTCWTWWASRTRSPTAQPALRRAAAERGHRPRPGQRPQDHRHRRANRQPEFAHRRASVRPAHRLAADGKTILMVTHDNDLAEARLTRGDDQRWRDRI